MNDWIELMTGFLSGFASSLLVVIIAVLFLDDLLKNIRSHTYNFFLLLSRKRYFLKDLRKAVTVYADGHIIVQENFSFSIINVDKLEPFRRFFDISDSWGDDCINEISFDNTVNINNRFSEMGFWWEVSNPNIIKEVKLVPEMSSSKRVVYEFHFDKNSIKENKIKNFRITTSFAVPKGAPILGGIFSNENCKCQDSSYHSGQTIHEMVKNFTFCLGIEKDIKYSNVKLFEYSAENNGSSDKKELKKVEKLPDNYYNKYIFSCKNPKFKHRFDFVMGFKS